MSNSTWWERAQKVMPGGVNSPVPVIETDGSWESDMEATLTKSSDPGPHERT